MEVIQHYGNDGEPTPSDLSADELALRALSEREAAHRQRILQDLAQTLAKQCEKDESRDWDDFYKRRIVRRVPRPRLQRLTTAAGIVIAGAAAIALCLIALSNLPQYAQVLIAMVISTISGVGVKHAFLGAKKKEELPVRVVGDIASSSDHPYSHHLSYTAGGEIVIDDTITPLETMDDTTVVEITDKILDL